MTLAEMATLITETVGQTDAASVAFCKRSIKRRYQVIYDSFDWKDARVPETLSFSAGDGLETLPATINRVVAVMLDGSNDLLDSVDAAELMAYDPTALYSTGTPRAYEEQTSEAGAHQLRLYPKPDSNVTVTIIGKRVRPELTDSTSPIIRNIDDALIALSLSDMFRRQRQVGKAKDAVEEGGALLDVAKKLETEQSNKARKAKNLTTEGNALGDMADEVCANVGDFRPETYIYAKQRIRRNYLQLWDSYLWKESRVPVRVASDGTNLILPEYVGRVTAVRASSDLGFLSSVEAEYLATTNPGIFDETSGTQGGFTQIADVAVKVLPPGLEKLSIRSTSASDTGNVFVFGESEGSEVSENVTLNGTTPVLTTYFYDTPLTITKPANTAGDIIIEGATSTVELQRILSTERERKHIRLWLHPSNTTGTTCLVLGKRRIKPLLNDQDTPMLRDAQAYLIEASTADAFSRFGKPAEASEARAKAEVAKKTLMSLETAQGAHQQRVVPTVEPYGGYYGSELYGKAYF